MSFNQQTPSTPRWKRYLIAVVIAVVIFLVFGFILSDKVAGSYDKGHLLYLLVLLMLIGSGLALRTKRDLSQALKNFLAWFVIFLVLITAYGFKDDFNLLKNRFMTSLMPSKAISDTPGQLSFSLSDDGHFHINSSINQVGVEFLLDTGASDIILSVNDAKRIGINLNELKFTKMFSTANGTVSGAAITLSSITIGSLTLNNIPASVTSGDLGFSLLGMRFLKMLDGYEVKGDRLTLYYK